MEVFLPTPRLVLRSSARMMWTTWLAVIEKATGDFLGCFHFRPGADAAPVRGFTCRQPWPYPIEGDQFGDVEYALDKATWEQLRPPWADAGPPP